tara:strand:- start:12023 stop:13486 length:1464 start_codon:yes stop_codon:yes gene_type:complete
MDYGLDQAQSNPESIFTEPTRFAYEFIRIKTDRSDATIDVKDVVSEFTIFEHIDKPFLTAKMILMDIDPNISLIDTIHFLGTEKVEIKIRVGPGAEQAITKNFVVSEIVSQQKGGDGNEVLVLDLVEDHAYLSSLKRISRSYKGKKEEIIEKLVNEADRELIVANDLDISGDKLTKLIVPNLHPLEAANWIKDGSYTTEGYPHYLFSTIADDKLRLTDLGAMLELKPINDQLLDYVYSVAYAQQSKGYSSGRKEDLIDPIEASREAFTITKLTIINSDKQLELAREGLIASRYNFIDTTSGNNIKVDYDMGTTFEKLIEKQILRVSNGFYPTMDVNARYGKKIERMNEFSTREITHFATSRQFNDYADTESYQEGKLHADHKNKIVGKSLRHWLLKSSLQIQVPGRNFLTKDTNLTIGNIIRCKFLSNREYTPNMARDEIEDLKKSGEYLIYTARHQFSRNEYHVTMDIGRLGTKGYGITPGTKVGR